MLRVEGPLLLWGGERSELGAPPRPWPRSGAVTPRNAGQRSLCTLAVEQPVFCAPAAVTHVAVPVLAVLADPDCRYPGR